VKSEAKLWVWKPRNATVFPWSCRVLMSHGDAVTRAATPPMSQRDHRLSDQRASSTPGAASATDAGEVHRASPAKAPSAAQLQMVLDARVGLRAR
jgi:hypothetical protein